MPNSNHHPPQLTFISPCLLCRKSQDLLWRIRKLTMVRYLQGGLKMLGNREVKSESPENERETRRKKPRYVESDCGICLNPRICDTNPLVYCSTCGVAFHKVCYGIEIIPAGDFYCEYCATTGQQPKKKYKQHQVGYSGGSQSLPVTCKLCTTQYKLPMGIYFHRHWIHLTCLLLSKHGNFEFLDSA